MAGTGISLTAACLAYRDVATMERERGAGLLRVRVECYAGYRGEQRPFRFYLKQRRIEVVEIIDQWYGPDYRYCKVRGDDDGVYILRHAMEDGYWELTMFSRGGSTAGV
jgi:hypothetical protein